MNQKRFEFKLKLEQHIYMFDLCRTVYKGCPLIILSNTDNETQFPIDKPRRPSADFELA